MNKGISSEADSVMWLELHQLYDDLEAFNEECAFLCDAFSRLMVDSCELDQTSIGKLVQQAAWIKQRVGEFKESVHSLREVGAVSLDG